MKLAIAGTGYVGLVTAVCMADKGHTVTCVDTDENKIRMLNNGIATIYENGLQDIMKKNVERLTYTTNYKAAYKDADIIFIAVGTPEKKDGSANLSYVYSVTKQIAESLQKDCTVVVKSTVPIGTNDKVEKILNDYKAKDVSIDVVSNPEFLAQGTAVRDTLHANRIIIGVSNKKSENIMRKLYEHFDAPVLITDRQSAEMIKYASNDFLALRISFINEIANLCELIGANIDDVAKGMGFDPRIGDKFLKAGIGYGGSCFPKDTKALHWLANMNDYEIKTIKAAIEVNEQQKIRLIKKAKKYYSNFDGLTVAVLGLSFKPGTDDAREAPSLVNIPILLDYGANIKAFDPFGVENFKKAMKQHYDISNLDCLTYYSTIDETIINSDICFIFTDWDEIKNYNVSKYELLMKKAIILDGRNCYDLNRFRDLNVIYESIGR